MKLPEIWIRCEFTFRLSLLFPVLYPNTSVTYKIHTENISWLLGWNVHATSQDLGKYFQGVHTCHACLHIKLFRPQHCMLCIYEPDCLSFRNTNDKNRGGGSKDTKLVFCPNISYTNTNCSPDSSCNFLTTPRKNEYENKRYAKGCSSKFIPTTCCRLHLKLLWLLNSN